MPRSGEITRLLLAWSDGDSAALGRLTPLIQAELHRLAQRCMARESPGHTLQATALVNEAYLKLIDQRRARWHNRAHFFAVSAQLMRRILVDHARRRRFQKRGGSAVRVSLDEAGTVAAETSADIVDLDDALEALTRIDPRQARVVELRFFGGLSVEETAEFLGISPKTVQRDWKIAKLWLLRELDRGLGHAG